MSKLPGMTKGSGLDGIFEEDLAVGPLTVDADAAEVVVPVGEAVGVGPPPAGEFEFDLLFLPRFPRRVVRLWTSDCIAFAMYLSPG